MKAIGLDIGTTTICGVLVDGQTGTQLEKYTVSNDASLTAPYSWQKLQDPDRIEQCCFGILNKLIGEYLDIAAIGDNQASFLGAVPRDGSVLVNVGTGSQISVLADQIRSFDQLECRPYRKGKYL